MNADQMATGRCQSPSLPSYRCHKVVEAFRIGRIDGCLIYSEDGGMAVEVPPEFFTKHPQCTEPVCSEPGYLVRYKDGYVSFSPAKAFEEGYERETGEVSEVLSRASSEIRALRQANAVLAGKVQVLDLVGELIGGRRPMGMIGESDWDVASRLDRLRERLAN